MNIFTTVLVVLLATGLVAAQPMTKLSVSDFEKALAAATDETLIDVRTPGEYSSGHLPNAVLIDVSGREFRQRAARLDKTKPVFVYCASGVRSERAAKLLSEMGFAKIFDLKGGINAWRRAARPIEK
jgi:rhodanese-related sulfurtransferase